MKRIIYSIVLLVFSACGPAPVPDEVTSVSQLDNTSTPVSTAPPTQTMLLTSTVTPTSTPSYPVLAGTPIPLQFPKITVQNANSLIALARYGGEEDVVWVEIDSIKDTNHGVVTSSMTLPPSEWHCPIESGYLREPKVFVGNHGEVAIVTHGELRVYEDGSQTPLHILPLHVLELGDSCPIQLHSVRVSGDMTLAAEASENLVDIYSIPTGQLITSLDNVKYPRLFSFDSRYFAAGNDGDQLAIYSTVDWKRIATIDDVIPYAQIAIAGFSVDSKSFVVDRLDGTATIYNLQDGTSYQSVCGILQKSCVDDANNSFNVIFDSYWLNHKFLGEAEYYFGTDGLSLLATRSFDVENKATNTPQKFSAIIEELCLERKNGEKLQCITPPEEGFPLDKDGNETFCWEKFSGMVLCEYIQPDGVFEYVDVSCDDPANCDSSDLVTSLSFKDQVFQDELPARVRELCVFPLNGTPACSQLEAGIFLTTKQVYTLKSVDDRNKEVYVGEGALEKLVATIRHKPPYEPSFNPIPLITMTPDQEHLIYATEYANPNTFAYEQILHVVDLSTGTEISRMNGQFARTMSVSPNSRFVGFTRLGLGVTGISLLDLEETIIVFSRNLDVSPALTFSPDSRLMVFVEQTDAGMGILNFYSIEEKEIGKQIELDFTGSKVSAVAFSPDGSILAIGFTNGEIHLYDVEQGIHFHTWSAHNGQVKSLEFSANGQLLLTVGAIDQYAKIWGVLP